MIGLATSGSCHAFSKWSGRFVAAIVPENPWPIPTENPWRTSSSRPIAARVESLASSKQDDGGVDRGSDVHEDLEESQEKRNELLDVERSRRDSLVGFEQLRAPLEIAIDGALDRAIHQGVE